jgi:replicative DNA helicase
MLDNTGYTHKPEGREVGTLVNRFKKAQPVQITLDGLAAAVARGCTFIPGVLIGDKSDAAWKQQQLFAIDIDNSIETGQTKGGKKEKRCRTAAEGYLSTAAAQELCSAAGLKPAMMYYSFNDQHDAPEPWERYRIIFILDRVITDQTERADVVNVLLSVFGAAADHCTDASRHFYGSRPGSVFYYNPAAVCSAAELLQIAAESKPAAQPEPIQSSPADGFRTDYAAATLRPSGGSRERFDADAETLLDMINPAALSYSEWVSVCSSFKAQGGTLAAWCAWCALYPGDDQTQDTKLYNGINHGTSTPTTAGTLKHYAQQHSPAVYGGYLAELQRQQKAAFVRDAFTGSGAPLDWNDTITAETPEQCRADQAGQPQPMPPAQPIQTGTQTAAPTSLPNQAPQQPQPVDFTRFCVGANLPAILQRFEDGDKVKPIKTQHPRLDELFFGGLRAGLYVLAAVPSWGKSCFAGQLCDAAAAQGRNALYFTLEMSTGEIVSRSISREMRLDADIDGKHDETKSAVQIMYGTRCGEWTQSELDRLERARIRYSRYASRVFVFEECYSMREIWDTCYNFVMQHPNELPPLIVIDYLQIMQPPADAKSTVDGLDRIATELKRMSRAAQAPVFVLSSTNRDSYKGSGGANSSDSGLASGRGSGAIEFSADVLMLGTWLKAVTGDGKFSEFEERTKNPRDVVVRVIKNRSGRSGTVEFKYHSRENLFIDTKPEPLRFGCVLGDAVKAAEPKPKKGKGRKRKDSGDEYALTFGDDDDTGQS